MEDFLKALAAIPSSNQMFVIAIVCIVGFGWVFVKVLNKQTDILGEMKTLIQGQVAVDTTRIAQGDKLLESVNTLTKELALHRIVSEAKDVCKLSEGRAH